MPKWGGSDGNGQIERAKYRGLAMDERMMRASCRGLDGDNQMGRAGNRVGRRRWKYR